MRVDQELPLFYVDSNVCCGVFFFHAWIFSGEDLGGYFHICGFTSNSMSVLKRM